MPKLTIHAHFYEPPRHNPFTGLIGNEQSAAPYRNWSERAAEEVYYPNAKLDNFRLLSFDMSDWMLDWLSERVPIAYDKIIGSVRAHQQATGVSNVLATPYHQAPLTQLSHRDKLTQLRWGKLATQKRYGYVPQGVLLPDFAADLDTLQAVVDAGYRYTLLKAHQIEEMPRRGGAGPYRITLPSGDRLFVFVADEKLSDTLVKEMTERGGSGYWAQRTLAPTYRHCGDLTVLYVDGTLLGKHHMAEAHFIHYLLQNEAPTAGFKPITLEDYFQTVSMHKAEVRLIPSVQPTISDEQRQLYTAMQHLTDAANVVFEEALGDVAWLLRDDYLSNNPANGGYQDLLDSQFVLQRARAGIAALPMPQMRPEVILNDVAYALQKIEHATQTNLTSEFETYCSPQQRQLLAGIIGNAQGAEARAG